MPYSEDQAQILRDALEGYQGISEKKMFGGLCFLLDGNMLCGVHSKGGMFRVGKTLESAALALPHTRPLDFTGRKMGGMVSVDDSLFEDGETLQKIMALSLEFVSEFPPK